MADSKKFPPLILELVDRSPSSFILQGTENTPNPEHLDVSSTYMLLNYSYIMVDGKTKSDPKIQKVGRWVSGCEAILIDEQKKLNVEYNPNRDIIIFKFGRLVVEREGLTVGLYDFLKKYDGNIDNPDRPAGAPPYFKEINTAIEAEERIMDIGAEAEAITFLARLSKSEGSGNTKRYIYATDKINWLCKLFNISGSDNDAERLEALLLKARSNPVYFNEQVQDAMGDLKVIIKTAREFGILNLDTDTASFVEGSEVICKLKSKNMNEKIDELAEYLKSSDGEMQNSVLRTRVEFATANMVGVKK